MNRIRLNSTKSRIFLGVFTTLFLLSFSSFAKKVRFTTSTIVPAARGYVKISHDKNRNYILKIQISNLAEVSRLQPSKSAYIVWMITSESNTMNLGQIKSSSGFLTKNLKASFETSTPFKPVQIFVTAEDDTGIQIPGTQMILTTPKF
jgi:hypothetical protein